MNWIQLLIWTLAGSGLAALFLAMQLWTIRHLNPDRRKSSKRLVIGGTILRWLLFSILIFLALLQSFLIALVAFLAFMITRLFLVFSISQTSISWPENNRLD